MARRMFPGSDMSYRRSGGLFKWLVIIAIIIAVLWYLNSKGIITIPWF